MMLSYITFAIFLVATFPQLQQTIQTGEARDLNWLMVTLNVIGNVLLGVHGYIQADNGIILLGFYFAAYWGLLLYYKSKENRQ
jgi:uncharacterized protein with PQ loop repeat